MRVVVAGASGFIGKALFERLSVFNEIDTIAVSRRSHGLGKFHRIDDYEKAPSGDVLVYCAEPSLVSCYCEAQRLENIARARKILNKGFKKTIYLSSVAVYGDKLFAGERFTESSALMNSSEYSSSKKDVENLFLNNGGVVFRLANVYGPIIKEESVFFPIYNQLKTQATKMYLRNKTSQRDFVWITDVVECLVNAILNSGANGVYNLGSGDTVSVDSLVSEFCQQLKREKPEVIETQPLRGHSRVALDIHKVSSEFNWRPKVRIAEGIKLILRNGF